jgi:mono/diheme cytochrome c family protein
MRRLLAAALALAPIGCSDDPSRPRIEFLPEMVDSVPYDSYAPNPVLRGGLTLQAPPHGTVARGAVPFRYGPSPEEAERAGRELANPVAPGPETTRRGEKVFQTFCSPCHGRGALGDGPVVPPFPTPPSLLAERARRMPDGRLYHVITRGQGLMPAHGAQVRPDDRWKVVHYLRALQGPAKEGP